MGAIAYLSLAIISPVALVIAPLGLMLALMRPGRREALIATVLLGLTVWGIANTTPGFARAEAAWVCLLAGGTAVALTLWPPGGSRPLVSTFLLAVGLAAGAAVMLVTVTSFSWAELRWLAEHKYGANVRLIMGLMLSRAQTPGNEAMVANIEATANDFVRAIGLLLPGLVLLQSVAALAAAWALYRLLARHPEGEPLPKLREFRFNDHMVWGVVLALIALVLPGGQALRDLGGNLAAFFGGLYVMRGFAVLSALAAAAGVGVFAILVLMVVVALLAPLAMFTALALGVTDTWVDWRKKTKRAS